MSFVGKYSDMDENSKTELLFRIYDTNGDGCLTKKEIVDMLRVSMKENNLVLDDTLLGEVWHSWLTFIDKYTDVNFARMQITWVLPCWKKDLGQMRHFETVRYSNWKISEDYLQGIRSLYKTYQPC